ncbi:hypothetical protein M427DRAFT_244023 [Gonapodya prolifera JEL478]|uniref:Uncharacterized protein n=1 Tax=Gonapodya prolifera (strain JEL478) TaxID=1344416 RepID=A0A139ALN2_GONPJ|nr:hypothetical protein M427DRAFT_244023 [Gonapodya prolifera JEL478]|eukprot:KXS17692.1 hypothetical protein M427DRAFT_244023 [Gonapodya prolifera JEL478]
MYQFANAHYCTRMSHSVNRAVQIQTPRDVIIREILSKATKLLEDEIKSLHAHIQAKSHTTTDKNYIFDLAIFDDAELKHIYDLITEMLNERSTRDTNRVKYIQRNMKHHQQYPPYNDEVYIDDSDALNDHESEDIDDDDAALVDVDDTVTHCRRQ